MSAFNDLIHTVSARYGDRIKSACSDVFSYFGLNQFFYYKITNDGRLALLDSNIAWSEYFSSEKYYLNDPFLRHPNNFHNELYLLKDDVQNLELRKILSSAKEKFERCFTLILMKKNQKAIEAFGFSSNTPSEKNLSKILSELPLLKLFIKKFRYEQQFLFSKLDDNQIDFSDLIGSSLFNISEGNPNKKTEKQRFLERLGIADPFLNADEIRVIKLLIEGCSAGQIGKELFRSKRTIEHRIEKIKGKFDCHSKFELIRKARELEQVGFL